MPNQEKERTLQAARSRLCSRCPHSVADLWQHNPELNARTNDPKRKLHDPVQVQARGSSHKTINAANTIPAYLGGTHPDTNLASSHGAFGEKQKQAARGQSIAVVESTDTGKKTTQDFKALGKRGAENQSQSLTTGGNTHLVVCPTCSACFFEPGVSYDGVGANASLRFCQRCSYQSPAAYWTSGLSNVGYGGLGVAS